MDSQEEDQPSSSRRRKKRGRTSESDKAPKKKAKSEDVDALIEETSQSDQTRMEQAKVIDVPQPKKDQFKAKLNEIFMSEHAQVRALQMTIFYRGIEPFFFLKWRQILFRLYSKFDSIFEKFGAKI